MKKPKKNADGHLIFENSKADVQTAKTRKELFERSKTESNNIQQLNKQVRRALELINILEKRINKLEGIDNA